MRRDLSVPLAVAFLAVAACPVAGLVPWRFPTSTPLAYLGLVLWVGGFALLLVVPWLRSTRSDATAALVLLAAAAPFVVFGVLETPAAPGTAWGPAPGWALLLVAALGAAALGGRGRAAAFVVPLLALWAVDALLAGAGRGVLSPSWNPARSAVTLWGGTDRPLEDPTEAAERPGLRVGAPVRLRAAEAAPFTEGAGPWYAPASRGEHDAADLLVLVVGLGGTESSSTRDGSVFVPAGRTPDTILALDAFDAALVLPGAWPADGRQAAAWADRLASFARRGGLLVGPSPDRAWPRPLGRRLGAAGRSASADGVAPYGLGHLARAASEERVHALLAGGAWRPRLTTVFDPPQRIVPPLPAGLEPWRDRPATRFAQGVLLLAYAVVAGALDRVLRGRFTRLAAILASALVVCLGLVWTSPRDPGVRVHGVVLDLGGGGGRRVEAVALAAGPAGWEGAYRWRGAGTLSVLGGEATAGGRVRVPARRTAWLVRDGVGPGSAPVPGSRDGAPDLLGLLEGLANGEHTRIGRGPPPDVLFADLPIDTAWWIRWR